MAKKPSIPSAVSGLRIGGGKHRGRKLGVIHSEGLRPTGDRMREVLFNWLQPIIKGATVLDLFAGSGALGIESVSRGAKHATLIERDRQVFTTLKDNASFLSADECECINGDAIAALSQLDVSKFDVVFLDPPFIETMWTGCLTRLSGALKPSAVVYVEAPKMHRFDDLKGFSWLKHKTQGQVQFGLLVRES